MSTPAGLDYDRTRGWLDQQYVMASAVDLASSSADLLSDFHATISRQALEQKYRVTASEFPIREFTDSNSVLGTGIFSVMCTAPNGRDPMTTFGCVRMIADDDKEKNVTEVIAKQISDRISVPGLTQLCDNPGISFMFGVGCDRLVFESLIDHMRDSHQASVSQGQFIEFIEPVLACQAYDRDGTRVIIENYYARSIVDRGLVSPLPMTRIEIINHASQHDERVTELSACVGARGVYLIPNRFEREYKLHLTGVRMQREAQIAAGRALGAQIAAAAQIPQHSRNWGAVWSSQNVREMRFTTNFPTELENDEAAKRYGVSNVTLRTEITWDLAYTLHIEGAHYAVGEKPMVSIVDQGLYVVQVYANVDGGPAEIMRCQSSFIPSMPTSGLVNVATRIFPRNPAVVTQLELRTYGHKGALDLSIGAIINNTYRSTPPRALAFIERFADLFDPSVLTRVRGLVARDQERGPTITSYLLTMWYAFMQTPYAAPEIYALLDIVGSGDPASWLLLSLRNCGLDMERYYTIDIFTLTSVMRIVEQEFLRYVAHEESVIITGVPFAVGSMRAVYATFLILARVRDDLTLNIPTEDVAESVGRDLSVAFKRSVNLKSSFVNESMQYTTIRVPFSKKKKGLQLQSYIATTNDGSPQRAQFEDATLSDHVSHPAFASRINEADYNEALAGLITEVRVNYGRQFNASSLITQTGGEDFFVAEETDMQYMFPPEDLCDEHVDTIVDGSKPYPEPLLSSRLLYPAVNSFYQSVLACEFGSAFACQLANCPYEHHDYVGVRAAICRFGIDCVHRANCMYVHAGDHSNWSGDYLIGLERNLPHVAAM